MKVLRIIRNYFCYCGIEKEEFKKIKKDAYISNFRVWRILHILMAFVFTVLFINSLISTLMSLNRTSYLILMIYSIIVAVLFFLLKEDSLIAQFVIYLSIAMLFIFGCLITQNKPNTPATTFIVLLLITPMFMLDKPYFMTLVIIIASTVFLIWMSYVKSYDVWTYDMLNITIFSFVGIIIHIIANSIRIKEFVLTRKINIQKDIDDLTGLKNKGALTRGINNFLLDDTRNQGIMILLDIDKFKVINDNYGHDVGDQVIQQLSEFLNYKFENDEIVGRFGGDEFIIFIKDTDDTSYATLIAQSIINGAPDFVKLPNGEKISLSLGIAIYQGEEKNYSEIFKKADIALYKAKADSNKRFYFY